MGAGAMLIISSAYLYLAPRLPSVDALRDIQLQTPLRIYSADGQLMGEFGEKRRTPVNYIDTPALFIQAILAAEDDSFNEHHGVDIKGLLRAAAQLIATGHIQTGGSTITMQVAKNFFLSREKTFSRKFNEIFLALQIERELSKEEILELYINKIYLGHRAYGIQAAAQVYYGTSIDQLNLAQLAMIAGLPKAPSSFNPITNPARALIRRNWILGRMLTLEFIDQQQYELAVKQPITARYHGLDVGLDAPYIAEMARQELLSRYGRNAYTDGYQVVTTVNSQLQRKAQQAVINGLLTYDQRHGYRGAIANFADQPELWPKHLGDFRSYGGLQPAIVTEIEDKALSALLANGETTRLTWEDGLSSMRPYINENAQGPKPKSVSDFAKVGDLIQLKEKPGGGWLFSQIPAAQAALVSLSPHNGAIISLVGGFDFQQSKFNRATQAHRQPGSNFKPLIYTAALEHGFTAASLINDAPIVFNDSSLEGTWRPANDSGKFYGPTRLRKALYFSRNLVSIRLLRDLGIKNAIDYVSRFGFDKKNLPHDLSLALGSFALTPLQLATVYASFANGGYYVEPYLIDKIMDSQGKVIFQANPLTVCPQCQSAETQEQASSALTEEDKDDTQIAQNEEPANIEEVLKQAADEVVTMVPRPAPRVIEERTAFIIDSILKDVIKRGTGRRALTLNRSDIAGKTGTTNGPIDAWFSGYQQTAATTTWLGFDQNQKLGRREYGGSAALPIWIEFMEAALAGVPVENRQQPDGIVTVLIDPKTGERASSNQQDAIFEIFRKENAPSTRQVIHSESGSGQQSTLPEELF
jgi:penicillin-binding protein 1A